MRPGRRNPIARRLKFIPFVALLATTAYLGPPVRAQTGSSDLSGETDSYLNRLADSGFSGAVLVAVNGEIVLEEGYGLADDADRVPVTADTVFLFGSITKQFTAAAILKLEADGRLRVTDPIADYLDAVPEDKVDITIHQLLTHSAGLQRLVFPSDFDPIDREEAVTEILGHDLLFEPGTSVAYSDDGYKLLAAIVEIVSGETWQSYLQTHLFEPAGMEDTGFFGDPKWAGRRVATGYASGRDVGSPDGWPGPYWALIGAGGVMSTVGDMYRWYRALQDGLVLPSASVDEMWSPYEAIGGRASFGYGWVIVDAGDTTFVETAGAGSSHNAYFHADDDRVVIVAGNRIDEPLLSRLGLIEHQETMYAVETGDTLVENLIQGRSTALPPFAAGTDPPDRPTTLGWVALGVIATLVGSAVAYAVGRRRSSYPEEG